MHADVHNCQQTNEAIGILLLWSTQAKTEVRYKSMVRSVASYFLDINKLIHFKRRYAWNARTLHPEYILAPPNTSFPYISMGQ